MARDAPKAADELARLMKERGYSIRRLAKLMAGDGASTGDIDNRRGQIRDWLNGQGIQKKNADRLAAVFDVPAETFRPPRETRDEETQRLREELAAVRAELAHHRAQSEPS